MQPFLQDLLEACYLRAHPEAKDRPCPFDWARIEPQKLARFERARKKRRGKKSGRASRASRSAAQQRYRDRQRARLGEERFNAQRAAQQSTWLRSETGQRYEARLVDLEYAAARKAKEQSKRTGEKLAALSLAQLEAPTYVVAIPGRKRVREVWPPRDAAALWIAAREATHRPNPDPLPADQVSTT